MKTEEKFVEACKMIIVDDYDKFTYWDDLFESVFSNDEEKELLKTKLNNLVDKLNENSDYWLSKDIETEIFNEI